MSARSRTSSTQQQQQQQQYTASTHYRGSDGRDSRPSMSMSSRTEPQNIMHDRRVIRGSTYSLRRSIESRLNDITQQSRNISKRNTTKRRVKSRKTDMYQRSTAKTVTPRPVSGRLHAEIQTDPYLEEIHVTKKEKEFGTQTDPFLDRPSTPLFIPKLSGKSMATQVEDGDLFDFDHEVEPILEVLVGKTIETSLMEVLEEEELKSFQQYKAAFEQKRNVELVKCQRLEEEERRREQEKENRIKQAQKHKEEESRLKERIEAQRIATDFLQNIEDAVLDELDKRGYFYDPVVREIETVFMPSLLKDVEIKVNDTQISNSIVDDIIQGFVDNMIHDSIQVIQQMDTKRSEDEKEEIFQRELKEQFVEKRRELTQCIKSQRNDYDFKQQIVKFLHISISVPPAKEDVENDDDAKENVEKETDENEEEIPDEIRHNIEFMDGLMENFENTEEPLWKQIESMLEKVGGGLYYKMERIDEYLETFSTKSHKKELLEMFALYKEDDEQLKTVAMDCLGIDMDTFDEETHGKWIASLKSEEQEEQMNAIDELIKDKKNMKEFISTFIKEKEEERVAAEEAAKAAEAIEEVEKDDGDDD